MQDQEIDHSQPNEVLEEAKTVDDAIEKGLARLGATADQVEIKVIDEGSKGVLGLIVAVDAESGQDQGFDLGFTHTRCPNGRLKA